VTISLVIFDKIKGKMAHHYVVTAQKPTAVTACVTGKFGCRINPKVYSLRHCGIALNSMAVQMPKIFHF